MKNFSRRSFLERVSVGAAVMTLPSLALPSRNTHQGKKLNIALVGLGRYAGLLAEGLQTTQHCKLAGIVTGTPSKAEDWKKRYNIPEKNVYNYQNFDEVARNADIDLIYIVLPNAMHKEYTIRAAKAGKHVIVEKPMAVTEQDCREMIYACNKAGVQLAMGYRLHYEPYNLEIKRLGQEKVFGKLKLIEVSLGYKSGDPSEWRVKKALAGGGPLMNLGVYCIQAARYVSGEEPTSVTAQFGAITNKAVFTEVEESITWQFQFASGLIATSSSTYNCRIDRFFASAENGFFELAPAISYGPFKGSTSNGDQMNFPEVNQQGVQCDEIAKVLLANKKLPDHISGKEGMQDVKIMQAIYKAAETGQRIII